MKWMLVFAAIAEANGVLLWPAVVLHLVMSALLAR